ncbi:MAG: MMPL family transporter, partial [Proteobacteria bacterium]|nr:MMPL family transporter [Pseudomonadota bacterium]
TPVFKGADRTWALHSVRLLTSSFDVADPARVARLLDEIRAWATQNQATLHMTGLPMFAAHGAASAYSEIRLFGTLSIVLITLMLFSVFRSLRPLALTILSVGSGVAAAFAITVVVFGQVHVLTLVFGSSLIGICVDYALHYLCRRFDDDWTPHGALRSVLPGIALGLVSSVAAFASLLVTPFPGLRQIAVFSGAGLTFAWLTVVLLLPVLAQRKPAGRTPAMMHLARAYQDRWPFVPRSVAVLLALVAAGIAAWGIGSLTPSDDIRLLQSAPVELLEEDRLVRGLLPGQFDSQFMLVKGADDAEVRLHEARLSEHLHGLVAQSALRSFRALSDHYPTVAAQRANYDLIQQTLYASGRINAMYAKIGISEPDIAAHMRLVETQAQLILSFDQWLAGIPVDWRTQWLGCNPQGCASVVRLSGIANPGSLQMLATRVEGVTYVDQVGDLSALLGRYREVASLLLAGVYALISALLVWRLGLKAALGVVCVPFAACVVAVASVYFTGNLFSLFNLFALLLVVGISIDYAIFFYLAQAENATTALAVCLSVLTTLLAFGMLSLSSTEVVHAFGQTLTAGLITAFLLAPFASPAVQSRLFKQPVGR